MFLNGEWTLTSGITDYFCNVFLKEPKQVGWFSFCQINSSANGRFWSLEIFSICRKFSLESKNQEKNLIETIKQNCRRIVKDKTGKKPFTNINIARI